MVVSEHAQARHAHLLDAVLDVLAEKGLSALSMRVVAARAGVSVAQVQYYFHTRAQLVEAAFEHASDQFLSAVRDILPTTGPTLRDIHEIVRLWLPLDGDRERRARVWLACSALAANDRRLAQRAARLDADLRSWFTEQLTALQRTGDLRVELDPQATATQLLALIDGLTVQALTLSLEQRQSLAGPAIEDWLTRLSPTAAHDPTMAADPHVG